MGFPVGTKKRISSNDSLQHFGFKTTKAGLMNLEKKLKENEIEIDGRRAKHAIYFRDPNGQLLELACYKFEPPVGATHADVLREAGRQLRPFLQPPED